MKKFIISVLIILLLLIGFFFAFNLQSYIPELPERFSKYHNTGGITVSLDEQPLSLENLKITYNTSGYSDLTVIEESVIENGRFTFNKGMYGDNIFILEIPSTTINTHSKQNVVIEFGQFNTNWWHVLDYRVQVDFEMTEDNCLHTRIKQIITYRDGRSYESENDAILNDTENKIKTYTGP